MFRSCVRTLIIILDLDCYIYNAPVPVLKTSSKHSITSVAYYTAIQYMDLGNNIASDKTLVMTN